MEATIRIEPEHFDAASGTYDLHGTWSVYDARGMSSLPVRTGLSFNEAIDILLGVEN